MPQRKMAMLATVHPAEFNIMFEGKNVKFSFNDRELFDNFNNGDNVRLAYNEVYIHAKDYVPPDFSHKQDLGLVSKRYRFAYAGRL